MIASVAAYMLINADVSNFTPNHRTSWIFQPLFPLFWPSSCTWSRRVLWCDSPYIIFFDDKVTCFHMSQRLILCTFYPSLQKNLKGSKKGHPVSSQRLSSWISQAIALTYELVNKPLPLDFHSHSIRGFHYLLPSYMVWTSRRSAEQPRGPCCWPLSHTIV